ncbi:MAG TPA: hypothetical protein V6C71_16615 [Coleofasciculaceae cyanobacterium]
MFTVQFDVVHGIVLTIVNTIRVRREAIANSKKIQKCGLHPIFGSALYTESN